MGEARRAMCASASYVGTQGRLRGSFAIREILVCEAESLGSAPRFGARFDRWAWALQPRPKRSCDRRCSSGSSLGKAPSNVRNPVQRTSSTETGGITSLSRGSAPWFVKPRRVSGRELRSGCGNAVRARIEAGMPLGKAVDEADGAPTPPGSPTKSSASWMRRVGGFDRDSVGLWWCS